MAGIYNYWRDRELAALTKYADVTRGRKVTVSFIWPYLTTILIQWSLTLVRDFRPPYHGMRTVLSMHPELMVVFVQFHRAMLSLPFIVFLALRLSVKHIPSQ